ncbi:SGNH/GDSL hydrolase family protein [Jiangella rhizosphaerae]|uniref:SGNH/GDSL hydrolase family protein n=1 Tax=Jiangella rhizosphaerae TaxID=2293569 RepID=A0A418KRF3_9ACTN|nr:SGNH/GDSL hydrolase family protein [Jiangella rhizosphaerae]RIQ23827.1 SGNH/GDSL hydrolase family protein [Jiangella rhizosphaerae]
MTTDHPARTALTGSTPVDWLFTGDSIVAAARWTGVHRGYADLFAERVRYWLGRRDDTVLNTAVSGWRVPALRDALQTSVLRHTPQVVVIGLGTNDANEGPAGLAAFRREYAAIVRRIGETTGAAVVLQTPPTVAPAAAQAGDLASYAQAVREVAADTGSHLVDHHAAWLAAGDDALALLADPLHPGPEGHQKLARDLLVALGDPHPTWA